MTTEEDRREIKIAIVIAILAVMLILSVGQFTVLMARLFYWRHLF